MLLSEPLCPACVVDNAGVVLHRVGVLLWSLSLVLEAGTEPHRQGILREGPAAQKGTSTQLQYTSEDFQSNQKVHEYSTTVHIRGFSVQSESAWVLNYSTHPGIFSPIRKCMSTQLQYTSGDFQSNQNVHEYSTTVHIWGFSVQSESAWVLNYSSHLGIFSPIRKCMSTQLQYTSGDFQSNQKVHEYSTRVHIWGFSVQSESAWVLNYSTHRGVSVQSQSTWVLNHSTQPPGNFSPIRKYMGTQL